MWLNKRFVYFSNNQSPIWAGFQKNEISIIWWIKDKFRSWGSEIPYPMLFYWVSLVSEASFKRSPLPTVTRGMLLPLSVVHVAHAPLISLSCAPYSQGQKGISFWRMGSPIKLKCALVLLFCQPYIPTDAISITDGQIFLTGDLFNEVRPAINVG